MSVVIPAIIPKSLDHLDETLRDVRPFAEEVQIDIVDGVFVPFTSWPYVGSGSVQVLSRYTTDYHIEVDLMVMHPEKVIDVYARTGVRKIVVHLESIDDIERIFAHHEAHTYELGLSILNDTPLAMLTPYLDRINYVQLMGIAHIGAQGAPFDERVLERTLLIHAERPALPISIDGSVNASSLPRLRDAGANRFVSGSAILGAPDMKKAYDELVTLASVS